MASSGLENIGLSLQGPGKEVRIEIDSPKIETPQEQSDFADLKIYESIEEFNMNLPSTVTLLKASNRVNVYLIGTAHFSHESQKDVAFVIRNVKPKVVVVELCSSRVHILKHDEKTLLEEAKDINIQKIRNVINANGLFNGLFYIMLLNMSAKLTKELGMAPGGEFRTAMKEGSKIKNCLISLGDRPINVTLQRAIKGLSLWQTLKLIWKLLSFDENITKEEVEACKQRDLLEELMKEMAGEFPAFGEVFVNERDIFLTHSLQVAALQSRTITQIARNETTNIVGVLGIGHCAGVTKLWDKEGLAEEIPRIMIIPKAPLSTRLFKFSVKYGTLSLIGYGIFRFSAPYVRKIW